VITARQALAGPGVLLAIAAVQAVMDFVLVAVAVIYTAYCY
jgi:hypothetical protein